MADQNLQEVIYGNTKKINRIRTFRKLPTYS